mmetsp:Transcript_17691/g.50936  ORF Transcript_17691/g.50936 Transcript_17691/m.50936 type:complete len:236 (-) Transcript_17691:12-719(-)
MFGLRHVGIHVLKVPESTSGAIASICVERIQSFVNLDCHQNTFFCCRLRKDMVMFQCLNDRFGHHYVHSTIDAFQGDFEMCVIRGKDDCNIPRSIRLRSPDIGFRVDFGVGWECLTSEIHFCVDISDTLLHVGSNSWKFFPINTTHSNSIYLSSSTKIKHGQSNNASTFVTVGCLTSNIAGGVFACPHHEYVRFVLCCHFRSFVYFSLANVRFCNGRQRSRHNNRLCTIHERIYE